MLGLNQSDHLYICYFKGTALTDTQGHARGVPITSKSAFGSLRIVSVLKTEEIPMNNLTIQPGFYAEVTDHILPYPVLHSIPTLQKTILDLNQWRKSGLVVRSGH